MPWWDNKPISDFLKKRKPTQGKQIRRRSLSPISKRRRCHFLHLAHSPIILGRTSPHQIRAGFPSSSNSKNQWHISKYLLIYALFSLLLHFFRSALYKSPLCFHPSFKLNPLSLSRSFLSRVLNLCISALSLSLNIALGF